MNNIQWKSIERKRKQSSAKRIQAKQEVRSQSLVECKCGIYKVFSRDQSDRDFCHWRQALGENEAKLTTDENCFFL